MPRQRLDPYDLRGAHWPPPGWDHRPPRTKAQQRANTKRQREWRRRRACGIKLLRVPVLEAELAAAMIESGRLSVDEALDAAALARGASDLLGDFARRWAEKA